MMIKRFGDWEIRLARAIAAAVARPFEFGVHDCCTAVCALVAAMTGHDLVRDLRREDDRADKWLVRQHGGFVGLCDFAANHYGLPGTEPALAGRGDLAVVDHDAGASLAIVDLGGRGLLMVSAKRGWRRLALGPCLTAGAVPRAWRIG